MTNDFRFPCFWAYVRTVRCVHESDSAQDQLRTLLDINCKGMLTAEKKTELDEMNHVNQFFMLIKARAMKVIKEAA